MVDPDGAAAVADPGLRADQASQQGLESREAVPVRVHRVPTLPKGEALSPGTHKKRTLPREETARLGKEIYERDIRPQVEDAHQDEYVAIDVSSGGWALSDDLLVAAASLRAVHPDAVNVWLIRVGHLVMGHILSPRRILPA